MRKRKLLFTAAEMLLLLGAFPLPGNHIPALRPPVQRQWIPAAEATVTAPGIGTFRPAEIVRSIPLDGEWYFSGLSGSPQPFPPVGEPPDMNLAKNWKTIPVPKSFYYHPGSKYEEVLTNGNLYFRGWYAREFELPATFGSVVLEFDAIGYAGTLFINGKPAGKHHGDFVPFRADITPFVRPGKNAIMLCVDSDFAYQQKGHRFTRTYGCRWDVGSIRGGIWGPVRMKIGPALTVERMVLNPRIDGSVEFEALFHNRDASACLIPAKFAVHSADALLPSCEITDLGALELPPGETLIRGKAKAESPRLWSPDDPNLYFATLFWENDGRVAGAAMERFGFREFKVDGRHFSLNGKPFYPAGESFHSNAFGGRGPDEDVKAKTDQFVAAHRSRYVNMLRTAHMPIAKEALDSADELGMCVYDEWSFTFIHNLDEAAFEKNNLEEFTRWFYRDTNHPSVVMWSLGNENSHKSDPAVARQLNKQTTLMRRLDPQKRPICTFSGVADFNNYGREKLDTDVIDLHHYQGIVGPWTEWDRAFEPFWKEIVKIYGENGELKKPLILWECVGGGWGPYYVKDFKYGDVDRFLKQLNVPFTPTEPHGAGYSGVAGLEPILDAARGTGYMQNYLATRLCELLRQESRLSGFAPWIVFPGIADSSRWSQPVMPGLRNDARAKLMYRQLLAPSETELEAFVANGGEKIADCRVRVELDNGGAEKLHLADVVLGTVEPNQIKAVNFRLQLPSLPDNPDAEICVTAFDGKREIGRNGYQITLHNFDAIRKPLQNAEQVLLIAPSETLQTILRELKVEFKLLDTETNINQFTCAILPWNTVPGSYDGAALRRWVERGNRLLMFAQRPGTPDGFPEYQFTLNRTCIAEFVVVDHPLFRNLSQKDFDLWAENPYGFVTETTLSPADPTMLGATGLFLGKRNTGMIAAEAVVGQGHLLIDSCADENLWGRNGGASRYLRNLIEYTVSPGEKYPARNIQPRRNVWSIPEGRHFFIDLKQHANRGFSDEVEDDGLGGWLDQGTNDFRDMPTGVQLAAGIPFDIIDPARNDGNSCIAVRGGRRPHFPLQATGIPIGAKLRRIYFLHTAGWANRGGVGWYRIHYDDGSHIDYPIIASVNIGDWWAPATLPEARPGICVERQSGSQICCFVARWENPHPEKTIVSMDFLSLEARRGEQYDFADATEAVPVLVAATGEEFIGERVTVFSSQSPHRAFSGNSTAPESGAKGTISLSNDNTLQVRLPATDSAAIPCVFISAQDQKKYRSGTACESLILQFRSSGSGRVDLVLPAADWRKTLTHTIDLERSGGKWVTLKLNLENDFLKENCSSALPLSELRPEVTFFNGRNRLGGFPRTEAEFEISELFFE